MTASGARPRGFTLIELLLVTLIIGIILGMAVTRFRPTFHGLAVREASAGIAQLMRYAQERAVMERKNEDVRLDPDAGTARLLEAGETDGVFAYAALPGREGRPIRVPDGATLSGSRNDFIFLPDGRCDDGWVSVRDAEGRGSSISVSGMGSKIELKYE